MARACCIFTTLIAAAGVLVAFARSDGVPAAFDCEMRSLALEFASTIQPDLTAGQLSRIADALNGSPEAQCRNLTWTIHDEGDSPKVPHYSGKDGVFVCAKRGDDINGDGSLVRPLRTIQAALRSLGGKGGNVILRQGTYRETVDIDRSHVTISSHAGERATLSGAVLIKPKWTRWAARPNQNIWRTPIANASLTFAGLRVDGQRAIRARYPNADPSTTLNPDGWISSKTEWLMPRITHETNPPVEYVVDVPEYTRADSAGNELKYQIGLNGSCMHLDPTGGYWCSASPNRTIDGTLTHRWPSGVNFSSNLLPNAPYKKPQTAIVHSCRGGNNCWFTWMFAVDSQSVEGKTLSWTKGGFQGAEGADVGGNWYIENVIEELDAPNEYFYDKDRGQLYYFYNASNGVPPPSSIEFESVEERILITVKGSQEKPVSNVTVTNLILRDARFTFMDPHGMPSGGDWALARSGAIRIEGSENLTVAGVLIENCDGNGISINNYNRNLTIIDNEIRWIGGTAIAAWGSTEQGVGGGNISLPLGMGIDGTRGNQPRGTRIANNFIHEIGIFQKQSSAYFQAQACQTIIERNIVFNGPRAHINFNDQFGGGNKITSNLLINACRETADHVSLVL